MLELDHRKNLSNHIDTMHAGALYALAEAASGEFLLRQFHSLEPDIIPVVRRVEIKYTKPAESRVYACAEFKDSSAGEITRVLRERKRALLGVKVVLYNESHEKLVVSIVNWFLRIA